MMVDLKLGKLPDRTPVKIMISVTPGLDAKLRDYLVLYRASYDDRNAVIADLIPAMLDAFLESDRAFARARKLSVREV